MEAAALGADADRAAGLLDVDALLAVAPLSSAGLTGVIDAGGDDGSAVGPSLARVTAALVAEMDG